MALLLGEVVAFNHIKIWWIAILLIGLVITKIITKKQCSVFVMIFLSALIGFLSGSFSVSIRDSVYQVRNGYTTVYGNVGKIAKTANSYAINLEDTWTHDQKNLGRVIVYTTENLTCKIGNIVEVKGDFEQFDIARNPGNFNIRDYYMSLGIFGKISADAIRVKDSNYDGLRQQLFDFKNSIIETLDLICNKGPLANIICSEKNNVYSAILLGDKSGLDSEMKELYSLSGIAHILAISGLHISFIGIFIYGLFRKKFGFGISATVSIFIVILFAIMTGMGVATIRAVSMFILRILADVIGREYDALTGISFAGLLLVLWNPFVLFNSGFQMSFVAIIGIVVCWPKLLYVLNIKKYVDKHKIDKVHSSKEQRRREVYIKYRIKVVSSILFSLNISLFMAPIVAYNYFSLPIFSFVLNLFVIPFMSAVIVSGILSILVGEIGIALFGFSASFLGTILIFPGSIILELFTILSCFFSKIPFSNIIVGKPSLFVIILFYVLYITFIYGASFYKKQFEKRYKKERMTFSETGKILSEVKKTKRYSLYIIKRFRIASVFAFIILISLLCIKPVVKAFPINTGVLETTFIDVGQGDGIFIKTPSGVKVMIDSGSTTVKEVSKYRIEPFLKADCNSYIDYYFLTHGDEDHICGLREMLKNDNSLIQIGTIVFPYLVKPDSDLEEIKVLAEKRGIEIAIIKKGDYLKFDEVTIECLHPNLDTTSDDKNDLSTVLEIKLKNFSMLMTGDLTSMQEANIPEKHYNVLKVGHHGSKYSTSDMLLSKIKPEIGIISVGRRNRYAHPARETLERLSKAQVRIFRTDCCGGITIRSNGDSLEVINMIE